MLAARGRVAPPSIATLQAARWTLGRSQRPPLAYSFSAGPPRAPSGKPGPAAPGGRPGAPPPKPPVTAVPPSSAGGSFAKSFVVASVAGATAITAYYYTLASNDEKASIDASISKIRSTVGLSSTPPVKKIEEKLPSASKVKESLPILPSSSTPSAGDVSGAVEESTKELARVVSETVEEVKEVVEEAHAVVAEAAEQIQENAEAAVAESGKVVAQVVQPDSSKAHEPIEVYTPQPPSVPRPVPPEPIHHEGPLLETKVKEAQDHMAAYEEKARDMRVDTLMRATEDLAVQSAVLRKELEATLLKDLDQLDERALRYRIIQLAAEMQERTKWEALRLHESLRKAEEETSRKFTNMLSDVKKETLDLLETQGRSFEEDKQNALRRLAYEKDEEWKRTLDNALAQQEGALKAAFQARLEEVRAEVSTESQKKTEGLVDQIQNHFKSMTQARLSELEDLRTKVAAIGHVINSDADYKHTSFKAHKVSAAVLAFEQKLETSEPVLKELGALRKVCQGDEVIETALKSLPVEVVGGGVPTLAELQVRFPRVEDAARQAAFVPESSQGLLGHMFASALATVTIKPRGLVQGEGTDEVLARAAYSLERGQLRDAVKELSALKGLPAGAVKDWLLDARARLLVEQVVKVVNSQSALLNSSLV